MYCDKCAIDLGDDSSKFCFSCGNRLKRSLQNDLQGTHQTPSHIHQSSSKKESAIQSESGQSLRGCVLVYDQATGNGIISSGGQRFEFNIDSWLSDTPPNVGMTVMVAKGEKTTFSPIKDADIAKERLSEFGTKVSQHGSEMALGWAREIGKPILTGYGVFIVGMFFLPFSNLMFAKPSLYEILKFTNYSLVAWLALASIAIPQFWKSRKSYYAYAIPFALLALALIKVVIVAYDAAATASRYGSFFGGKSVDETSMIFSTFERIHFELGFWVVISSATWLAYKGFAQVKSAA